MKIVKRVEPVVPATWDQRFECGFCRSELQVQGTDLTLVNDDDPRDQSVYIVFQCPVCNKYNDIYRHVSRELSRELKIGRWDEVCAVEAPRTAKLIPTR